MINQAISVKLFCHRTARNHMPRDRMHGVGLSFTSVIFLRKNAQTESPHEKIPNTSRGALSQKNWPTIFRNVKVIKVKERWETLPDWRKPKHDLTTQCSVLWKLIQRNLTKMESGGHKGELSRRYHPMSIPVSIGDLLCSSGRTWHYFTTLCRRKKTFLCLFYCFRLTVCFWTRNFYFKEHHWEDWQKFNGV